MKYFLAILMLSFTVAANACIELNEPWLQFVMKPNQKFYDAYSMVLWEKEGEHYIKGAHGIMSGKQEGDTLYDCQGVVVARMRDNSIYDETGSLIYRLRDGSIEDNHGSVKFRIKGDTIYDAHGILYGKLDMY